MLKTILGRIINGEKGFTLIELLAVMGIVAVLAAIVSTSVTGTGEKSRDTTAEQDAGTVNTSAGSYFADQGAPVLTTTTTPLTITSVSGTTVNVSGEANVTSSAWPEAAIASTYSAEFQSASEGTVKDVTLTLDDGSTTVDEATLMAGYTAVKFTALEAGYSDKTPDSESRTQAITLTDAGTVTVHEYLWLFEKDTSSYAIDEGTTDDARFVTVFKLASVTEDVTTTPNSVTLNYEQIF